MKIEPWLSLQIGMVLMSIPSSCSRDVTHMACQPVSDKAIYSASVEDRAMVFWARDCHVKMLPANLEKLPVINWHLIMSAAQLESVYAIRHFPEVPSKTNE